MAAINLQAKEGSGMQLKITAIEVFYFANKETLLQCPLQIFPFISTGGVGCPW